VRELRVFEEGVAERDAARHPRPDLSGRALTGAPEGCGQLLRKKFCSVAQQENGDAGLASGETGGSRADFVHEGVREDGVCPDHEDSSRVEQSEEAGIRGVLDGNARFGEAPGGDASLLRGAALGDEDGGQARACSNKSADDGGAERVGGGDCALRW